MYGYYNSPLWFVRNPCIFKEVSCLKNNIALCLCPLISAYSSIFSFLLNPKKKENKTKDIGDEELFHINGCRLVARVSGVFCVSRGYWFS
jgi:hypothetical protein